MNKNVVLFVAFGFLLLFAVGCASTSTTAVDPDAAMYNQAQTLSKDPYSMTCVELKQEMSAVVRLKQRLLQEQAQAERSKRVVGAIFGIAAVVAPYAGVPTSGLSFGDIIRIARISTDITMVNNIAAVITRYGTIENYERVLRDAWEMNGCRAYVEKAVWDSTKGLQSDAIPKYK